MCPYKEVLCVRWWGVRGGGAGGCRRLGRKTCCLESRGVIHTRLLSQSSFGSRRENKVQSCFQREEKRLWVLIYRAAAAWSPLVPPHPTPPPFCLPPLYQPSYCPLKCFYLQTSQAARSPVLSFSWTKATSHLYRAGGRCTWARTGHPSGATVVPTMSRGETDKRLHFQL